MMTPWAPRTLAVLRIVTALLFLEYATMKFFAFPAEIPGVPHPFPTIMLVAGAIEVVTGLLMTVGLYTRVAALVAAGEMAADLVLAHLCRLGIVHLNNHLAPRQPLRPRRLETGPLLGLAQF